MQEEAMDFSILEKLVEPTFRLLLFLDIHPKEDFYEVCKKGNLSEDQLIKTRCSGTSDSIEYLLSFYNVFKNPPNIKENKVYIFELVGVDKERITVRLNHVFTLIVKNNECIMMDSYIGKRGYNYKIIKLEEILGYLRELNEKYDNDVWIKLTGCSENNQNVDNIAINFYEYDYNDSLDEVKIKFRELINVVKKKILCGNFKELRPLSSNNDINSCIEYLDNLVNLI